MINLDNLIRDNIRDLRPLAQNTQVDSTEDAISLNSNENAFGSTVADGYNRYPDPLHNQLRSKIAEMKDVSPEQIFIGSGSDEAIDLLFRIFCRPEIEQVIVMPPTYNMFSRLAQVNDAVQVFVPLTEEFQIDTKMVLEAINANTKLIFICSPNNPTANCMDYRSVETIIQRFQGIVVLDENYIDYASTKTLLGALNRFPNLVILQTFSNAWGLANLRLGMAFADKEIIQIMYGIKSPFNVSGHSQLVATEALSHSKLKDDMVKATLIERRWLQKELSRFAFVEKVYPSETNFLLVKTIEPKGLQEHLLQEKIEVANFDEAKHCHGCLRITIGAPQENRRLIAALKSFTGD